jgi:hypothetical protein
VPAAPWTGVKHSGTGVASGVFALNHYTRPRTIAVDRNTSPDAWWFPMDARLEELGNRLAEALLGNPLAAVKVPLLIWQRERSVIGLVQSAPERRSVLRRVVSRLRSRGE